MQHASPKRARKRALGRLWRPSARFRLLALGDCGMRRRNLPGSERSGAFLRFWKIGVLRYAGGSCRSHGPPVLVVGVLSEIPAIVSYTSAVLDDSSPEVLEPDRIGGSKLKKNSRLLTPAIHRRPPISNHRK